VNGIVRRQGSPGTLIKGIRMTPPDPTDGAIREGEPPYVSGHGSGNGSTNRTSPPPTDSAILAFVWALRAVAVVLAGWAAYWTYFAMWFRLEGFDELQWVKQEDLKLGGAFALAVVLFFVPGRFKKSVQCILIIGIAALAWFCVSGYLISSHEWQYRVRSGH
jgi:hypothetical protein